MKNIIFLILILGFSLNSISAQAFETKSLQFSPADKSFSVWMPGKPEIDRQETPDGVTAVENYLLNTKTASYTLARIDLSAIFVDSKTWQKGLDSARDRLSLKNGKLTAEKAIMLNGFPGKELKFAKSPGLFAWARLFLIRNYLYQIVYIGEEKPANLETAAKFLDSFQVNLPAPDSAKTWNRFVYEKDNFSILFPGKPTDGTIDLKDENIGKLKMTTLYAQTENGTYAVVVSDLTDLPIKDRQNQINFLAGAIDGLFKQAKIIKTEEMSVQGNYGWDVAAKNINGMARWRGFFAPDNKKCYQIYFLGTKQEALSLDTDKFFDSFEFIKTK